MNSFDVLKSLINEVMAAHQSQEAKLVEPAALKSTEGTVDTFGPGDTLLFVKDLGGTHIKVHSSKTGKSYIVSNMIAKKIFSMSEPKQKKQVPSDLRGKRMY